MRLLRPSQMPEEAGGRVYRSYSWVALAGVAAAMTGAAAIVFAATSGGFERVLAAVPLALAVALGAMALYRLRACLQPGNWLLREHDHGVYVNLRSFLNFHLPEAETVLYIPRGAIAAVGKVYEKLVCPARYGSTVHHSTYITLYLDTEDTGPIAQALRAERRRIPLRSLRRKTLHYPVRLPRPGELRLLWDWTRPGENTALDRLAESYPLAPKRNDISADWDDLDEAAKAAYIDNLWELGYVDEAKSLYRRHHKASEQDARRHFARLMENPGEAAPLANAAPTRGE